MKKASKVILCIVLLLAFSVTSVTNALQTENEKIEVQLPQITDAETLVDMNATFAVK